jgi:hypothetical protein
LLTDYIPVIQSVKKIWLICSTNQITPAFIDGMVASRLSGHLKAAVWTPIS